MRDIDSPMVQSGPVIHSGELAHRVVTIPRQGFSVSDELHGLRAVEWRGGQPGEMWVGYSPERGGTE